MYENKHNVTTSFISYKKEAINLVEDVRIIKNKRNIEECFIKLLKEKDFSHITVKDICQSSLNSRSTFYSYYLDKYDLLEKIVQRFTNTFEQTTKQRFSLLSNQEFTILLSEMIEFYLQYQEELSVLLNVHVPKGDLTKEIEMILFKHCQSFLQKKYKSTKVSIDLISTLYSANVLALIKWYLNHGKVDKQSIDFLNELQNIIFSLIE